MLWNQGSWELSGRRGCEDARLPYRAASVDFSRILAPDGLPAPRMTTHAAFRRIRSLAPRFATRLGTVTGFGLAGVIRVRYSRWILWSACALLVIANIVNIAADLGGMASVTELLTGIRSYHWTPAYAILLVCLLFWAGTRERRDVNSQYR